MEKLVINTMKDIDYIHCIFVNLQEKLRHEVEEHKQQAKFQIHPNSIAVVWALYWVGYSWVSDWF